MNNPTLEIKNKFDKKLRQILSLPEVKVIDFKTVGYPFYRISLNVIIRENRKLNLIEEFILKSIQSGLDTLEEIALFLGLVPQGGSQKSKVKSQNEDSIGFLTI